MNDSRKRHCAWRNVPIDQFRQAQPAIAVPNLAQLTEEVQDGQARFCHG